MKGKILACSFYALFLLFLPLPVRSQGNSNSRVTVNQQTMSIVDRCDRVVMKGIQEVSRGNNIDRKASIEDIEEIEFQYVDGPNGYMMIFVRDKNNPKSASQKCIGFISKNSDLKVKSNYPDGKCEYMFSNKTANTFVIIVCEKGEAVISEYYLGIGIDNNPEKADVHLITHAEFYEKGSATPSLKVYLNVEDYSINLFKYFLEKILAKYE